jgi:hypothetical protein
VQGHLNELATERFWAELTKVFQETRPDLFFDMMYRIRGDTHVAFFSGLYGNFKRFNVPDPDMIKNVALALGFAKPNERVMLHVALTATTGDVLKTADTRTQALHENVRRLQNTVLTADSVYNLLKQARAWSEGTSLDDLWKAIVFGNAADLHFTLTPAMLRGAVAVTNRITAADYMNSQTIGKALGDAIERGRKKALMDFIGNHD